MKSILNLVTGLCREVPRACIETDREAKPREFDHASITREPTSTVGIILSVLRKFRKAPHIANIPQHGPVTAPPDCQLDTFDEIFSEANIIRCLLKQRAKLRKARHKKQFSHLVSKTKKHGEYARKDLDDELKELFPPRRTWAKYRPSRRPRNRQGNEDVNQVALERAVFRLMREHPDLPWARKLRERAEGIRTRALHEIVPAFDHPRVIGVRKNAESHEYRPIAMYGTDDAIIQKLTARYLNRNLDFCFSSSSLAYRCARENSGLPLNRETALHRIIEFLDRHPQIFVAEADLRNFMDCVDHQMARESLGRLIRYGTELRPDLRIAPRAIQIYNAFLASYDFRREVLGPAHDMLRARDPQGVFPWPEGILLKMREYADLDAIGIPQGSALSCFAANVMLHDADMVMDSMAKANGKEFLYLRFCDDMLILSSEKDTCQQAMDAYQNAVKGKMLPMHEPEDLFTTTGGVNLNYRELKSKNPYLWSESDRNGVPWIQFLGFEIRHDGMVRIRKKSLDKQCSKMTEAANKLIRIINPRRKTKNGVPVYAPGLRMDPHVILDRFEMKLIAMSVGRREFDQPSPSNADEIMPMCWANGYRALWFFRYDPAQLKRLDRHRRRQLQRVRDVLRPLMNQQERDRSADDRKKSRHYRGAPFSYYGQFAGKRRIDVIGRCCPAWQAARNQHP